MDAGTLALMIPIISVIGLFTFLTVMIISVTNNRRLAREKLYEVARVAVDKGQPLPPLVSNCAHRLVSLDGKLVCATTATECKNWFGEFSNAVFRADSAALLLKPEFGGVSYAGLWDLGAFMAASLRAPIGYLQDHLGYFRTGALGNSAKFFGPYMKGAHLGYAALALGAQRIGQYSAAQARNTFSILASVMPQRYGNEEDMRPFIALLPAMATGDELAQDSFVEIWHAYLRRHGF